VAFVAVTVRVEELPAVIEAGLATRLTVGAGVEETVGALPPQPVMSSTSGRLDFTTAEERFRNQAEVMRTLVKVFSFIS
jgi:hypothetical protein